MKTKKAVSKKKKSIAKGNWPQKRNVLFRPERMKYVRKILKTSGCVFCHSANEPSAEQTLCVYKTQYSQIVLNKYPYNSGHVLVLPLSHVGNLLSLSPERFEDLHLTLRLAVRAIEEIYSPGGYNIGLNNGAAAGAGIPDHLHYHLIPRWSGDLNFFPLVADTKVVLEKVEDSYKKFAKFFEKVKA